MHTRNVTKPVSLSPGYKNLPPCASRTAKSRKIPNGFPLRASRPRCPQHPGKRKYFLLLSDPRNLDHNPKALAATTALGGQGFGPPSCIDHRA
jgi:hypothetical protein